MTIRTSTRLAALAAVAAAAVALSACGTPAGGAAAPATSTAAAAAAKVPAGTPTTSAGVGTVLVANGTDKLGTVVVDGQGYTLYRFDKDTAKPPVSNCAGECAKKWPPVLATPGTPLTVEGVAEKAVGTINRPDGSIQLTLGGWPVYRYSGDTEPGAVTGQGVSGTWAAVTPQGGKAAASPAPPPAAQPTEKPVEKPAEPGGAGAADEADQVQSGY